MCATEFGQPPATRTVIGASQESGREIERMKELLEKELASV
jgi:hypothetical protein